VVALEERCGARLRGHGDKVEIRAPEKAVSELLAMLLAADAEIISVTPQRESLEQIFLSAVEGRR